MDLIELCEIDDPRLQNLPCRIMTRSKAFVLWRDDDGHWKALEDRCPHQHKRLSTGRIVEGNLVCAYHGWSFSPEGEIIFPSCKSYVQIFPVKIVERRLLIHFICYDS